jgi:ADP-heptose:LPS heptosyltransferase
MKVWPVERFAYLADRLKRDYGATVHFVGGGEDGALHDRIAELSAERHVYYSTLSLGQTVGLISACDLFVGNDSGLSHIAAALNRPLIVLWGPVNLEMARPKAPPERCAILYHDLPCRARCPEISCNNPIKLECLRAISVEEVLSAVSKLDVATPATSR